MTSMVIASHAFAKPQPAVMGTRPARIPSQKAPKSKSPGGNTMACTRKASDARRESRADQGSRGVLWLTGLAAPFPPALSHVRCRAHAGVTGGGGRERLNQ